jgi:hypothetical protein
MRRRSQESGVRSQESGVRSQESGVRSQEPGARSQEHPTGGTREDFEEKPTLGSRTSSRTRTIGSEERVTRPAPPLRLSFWQSFPLIVLELELVLVLDSLKADEVFIFAHTNNSLNASSFRGVRSRMCRLATIGCQK